MDLIYGIYPGIITDEERYKECSEIELFYYIAAARARISEAKKVNEDTEALFYTYQFLVAQTSRFGVKTLNPNPYKRIDVTEDFAKWSKYWQVYCSNPKNKNQVANAINNIKSSKQRGRKKLYN